MPKKPPTKKPRARASRPAADPRRAQLLELKTARRIEKQIQTLTNALRRARLLSDDRLRGLMHVIAGQDGSEVVPSGTLRAAHDESNTLREHLAAEQSRLSAALERIHELEAAIDESHARPSK